MLKRPSRPPLHLSHRVDRISVHNASVHKNNSDHSSGTHVKGPAKGFSSSWHRVCNQIVLLPWETARSSPLGDLTCHVTTRCETTLQLHAASNATIPTATRPGTAAKKRVKPRALHCKDGSVFPYCESPPGADTSQNRDSGERERPDPIETDQGLHTLPQIRRHMLKRLFL